MAGNFTPGTGADFHFRGSTDGGAPASGSFVLGDWVETPTGIMVCQVGGSPGLWGDMATTEAGALVSDTAYDATTWDGVTTIAPSKNAVRDKIEALTGATAPIALAPGMRAVSGATYYLLSGSIASGAQIFTNGKIYSHWFEVAETITFDGLTVQITQAGNAGAKLRFTVYKDNGHGVPQTTGSGAVVAQLGSMAADATGPITLSFSLTLPQGKYHLGHCVQANGATQVQAWGRFDAVAEVSTPELAGFTTTPSGGIWSNDATYTADAALPDPFPALDATSHMRRVTHIGMHVAPF